MVLSILCYKFAILLTEIDFTFGINFCLNYFGLSRNESESVFCALVGASIDFSVSVELIGQRPLALQHVFFFLTTFSEI